ncbi:hypothetical protein BDW42DRAFT_163532 [Aspergillus taichungensis]|uniref:Uncharacterized protein n=1 Tax=Aspergillus taichungensis TaxID=482145 RepID=A0A2J5I2W5_9EURO|nr:hypothetical protein BDW42DRAFT_163532 [Aspergillus taichungensis]
MRSRECRYDQDHLFGDLMRMASIVINIIIVTGETLFFYPFPPRCPLSFRQRLPPSNTAQVQGNGHETCYGSTLEDEEGGGA